MNRSSNNRHNSKFDNDNKLNPYISVQKSMNNGLDNDNPFIFEIRRDAFINDLTRKNIWTGEYLQISLLNIDPGQVINIDKHPDIDEYFYIVQGEGNISMGKDIYNMMYSSNINNDDAIVIPAGMWHSIKNTGNVPLKLVSIHGVSGNPFGT